MNLNYLFYRKYFDFFADDTAVGPGAINRAIVNATVRETEKGSDFSQTFYMKTTYPGLLIGIGNPHAAAADFQNTDAIKIGFALDYVTGLPVIPGSTIKGILRSAFSQHPEYVIEKLGEATGDSRWLTMSTQELKELENRIFGGHEGSSAAVQDVFLDAVPVRAANRNRLLGEDFITSHKGSRRELDGLTEPNPVRMLKVLPEVVFEFRFICQTTTINDRVLDWNEKKLLYAGILEDLGVGAKTNTGYGNMILQKNTDEYHHQLEIDTVEIKAPEEKQPPRDTRRPQGRQSGKPRYPQSDRKGTYR